MAVAYDGTGDRHTYTAAVPNNNSWSACFWVMFDADTANLTGVFGITDGTFPDGNEVAHDWGAAPGRFQFRHNTTQDTSITGYTGEAPTATWIFVGVTYTGETTPGSSADGTFQIYILEDGDSAFQGDDSIGSVSDQTATQVEIGHSRGTDITLLNGKIALVKIWSGTVLTEAQLLTERQYRNAQTGTLWAHYKFESGALTTDSSGNSRTLTETGDPTYSSAEPSAILGDDPAAGGMQLVGGRGLVG